MCLLEFRNTLLVGNELMEICITFSAKLKGALYV